MKNLSQYAQYAFIALFVLSALAGFRNLQRSQEVLVAEVDQVEEKSAGVTTSYISMAITLAGFVVSTVMNVRKERREAKEAALNLKQMELELEKTRMELEAMKKEVKGE
jgi:hypothetical protein